MKKVTIVTFSHCEDPEPRILAVVEGGSKAKAKKVAVLNHANLECPARIVTSSYSDQELVLEERFMDDSEGRFTDWMESGTIQIETHKVA